MILLWLIPLISPFTDTEEAISDGDELQEATLKVATRIDIL